MIAGQTEPGYAPAPDVAKLQVAAGREDFGERSAARVRRTQNAPDACAGDMRDRDVILLEYLQHAEMRETTRKAATKGDADSWTRFRRGMGRRVAADWGLRVHESENEASNCSGQWEARPEIEVQKYCERNRAKNDAQTRNSTFLLVSYPLCTIAGT